MSTNALNIHTQAPNPVASLIASAPSRSLPKISNGSTTLSVHVLVRFDSLIVIVGVLCSINVLWRGGFHWHFNDCVCDGAAKVFVHVALRQRFSHPVGDINMER
eukprot:4516635-Pyramimonas_sp.AAC.1